MKSSTHILLHTLWTKAVGTPGYEKREWKELARLLEDLESGGWTDDRIRKPT